MKQLITIAALMVGQAAFAAPEQWISTWGAAQMVPDEKQALKSEQLRNSTIRETLRLSIGGKSLRLRFSNLFGTSPLVLGSVSVARAVATGSSDIVPESLRQLSFGGKPGVTIPPGAEYYSDPVALEVAAGSDLAVSIFAEAFPERQTAHPGSRTTNWVAAGNQTAQPALSERQPVMPWFFVDSIEVRAPQQTRVVVAIGDSITDGAGSTTNGNDRWTDALRERLSKAGIGNVAVINAGIGGNRMLRDGLGPNLMARFERDVLGRAGVSHAVVLIGVNDVGGMQRAKQDTPAGRQQMLADMKEGWRQLVARAHARGVCVLAGTLTPYGGGNYYQLSPENEADRRELNQWLRESPMFDGVADFDQQVHDPVATDKFKAEYDSGDHLHPSPTGYRAIAEAVPLEKIKTCALK